MYKDKLKKELAHKFKCSADNNILKYIVNEVQKELLKELISDWYNNKEKKSFGIRLSKRLRDFE